MRTPAFLALASLTFAGAGYAIEDAPPIDVKSALQTLSQLKEQQTKQVQGVRARAIQDASAAVGDPARAVALWEEAIRATQFQGASKEGAQWRDWREKEGDALKEREVQSALRLHFNWLMLTLRHADGAETPALLPSVMAHVKEAIADEAAMDAFDEAMKKEREAAAANTGKRANPRDREKRASEQSVKKMHDQIAKSPLTASPYVEWMRLTDMLQDVAPGARARGQRQQQPANLPGARTRPTPSSSWEITPANVDGIYTSIIQPALREAKDPRIVDYWDYRLRREADAASRTKLQFEIDKFNQMRRPQLLWGRMADMAAIGLKNSAAGQMLAHIKSNASHPDVANWITELETLLSPPEAAPAPAPPAGSAAAAPTGTP